MDDELRKPIKWDRPCYKCGSHYCDLSCPDRAKNANAVPQDQDAKDAARYRFMRGNEGFKSWSGLAKLKPIVWDEYIDAAMQQEQKP